MELINKPDVAFKNKGDSLTLADVNNIVSSVNSLVDAVNYMLGTFCNVALEVGDLGRRFNLPEAISVIGGTRRSLGLTLAFIDHSDRPCQYTYRGSSVSDSDWSNLRNWESVFNKIDGGQLH